MRRRIVRVPLQTVAVLGTTYLLLATTAPFNPCRHWSAPVAFHVAGDCGPGGVIVVANQTPFSSHGNNVRLGISNRAALGLPPLPPAGTTNPVVVETTASVCPFKPAIGSWSVTTRSCREALPSDAGFEAGLPDKTAFDLPPEIARPADANEASRESAGEGAGDGDGDRGGDGASDSSTAETGDSTLDPPPGEARDAASDPPSCVPVVTTCTVTRESEGVLLYQCPGTSVAKACGSRLTVIQ